MADSSSARYFPHRSTCSSASRLLVSVVEAANSSCRQRRGELLDVIPLRAGERQRQLPLPLQPSTMALAAVLSRHDTESPTPCRTTLRGCAAVDRFPTEHVADFLAAGVPKQSAARSWCGDGTEASARSRAYKDRCQLGAKGTADAAMEV